MFVPIVGMAVASRVKLPVYIAYRMTCVYFSMAVILVNIGTM